MLALGKNYYYVFDRQVSGTWTEYYRYSIIDLTTQMAIWNRRLRSIFEILPSWGKYSDADLYPSPHLWRSLGISFIIISLQLKVQSIKLYRYLKFLNIMLTNCSRILFWGYWGAVIDFLVLIFLVKDVFLVVRWCYYYSDLKL